VVFTIASSLLLASGLPVHSQEYRAWISVESEDSRLRIVGFCEAPEDGYVTYELKAVKTGGSGKSETSQSGRVYVTKGEAKGLSRLRLGVLPDDSYVIRLKVYKGKKLVADDSVSR